MVTPNWRLIIHCWAIDRMLFVSQYNTRPAGKKKNMMPKPIGMIHMILAWIGWITDLSIKDPYFVLPALMTLSTLLQTWLNPTPPYPL